MKLVIVGTTLLVGGFLYLGWRLIGPFKGSRRARIFGWAALSSLLLAVLWFPATWYLPVSLEGTWGEPIRHWVTFVAMGGLLLLGLTVVLRDLLLFAHRGLARIRGTKERAAPDQPERREFLGQVTSVGAIVATGAIGFGSSRGARRMVIERVRVPVEGLPSSFEGFRIAQISDVHVGHTIRRPFVSSLVECVNSLDADIVAITGDLTDGTVDQLENDVAPLAGLRSREGFFFVTGNHDYYWGDAEGWVRHIDRLGGKSLVNEHQVIEREGEHLVVAGITDYRAGDFVAEHRSDPRRALLGAPPDAVRILLAHQPRSVTAASAQGFDLQLSGHTHGGQIFPFHLVALLSQPVLAGLHRFGSMWLYVNRGSGYWGPPFRLFAPPEVTILELVRQ